jgi:hypothetical protein
MELNPCEAVINNIGGTRTLVQAADLYDVEKVIMISTDKAVNPTSIMGASKRVAELVVHDMASQSQTSFMIVRFGNVLGSNGSVVPRFLDQIRAGGPVTVTHPEMRRFFMLIPEAVQLVLQAAAMGESGATYVLEMGEQVKVVDLARNLIRLSGLTPDDDISITFVGLRPGEKLYEELVGPDETVEQSPMEKILQVSSQFHRNREELVQLVGTLEWHSGLRETQSVIDLLCELIPTFKPTGTHSVRKAEQVPAKECLRRVIEESVIRPVGAERRVRSLVRKVPVSSSKLNRDPAHGISSQETASSPGIQRDEPRDGQAGDSAVLQQAGNRGAVDQKGQVGDGDATAKLPPIPIHQGATVAEPHRIQPE